jgi:hypothetical protein
MVLWMLFGCVTVSLLLLPVRTIETNQETH